ncbi:uncharacterized protein DUF4382 [Chitinophaga niastensis]|uniref:Uncharacterized protein DUF4382 n=1 Tax=Chitinophaga niastensis TaxID=536980 RepID=A0A2P8HHN7_CHINA|nr:DUF4382 domain-containing protein [Chitinophaga niastensis]PSL45736.1 uncharacterized protein DUF4382 [Chitinophaga niastensis]
MAILFVAACSKSDNNTSGDSRLSVYLTDAPSNYDAVLIDIQDTQVNNSTDPDNGWQSLHLLRPGVYDLLKFKNGVDTVLASVDIPAGKISQIRLILGANNSVVIGGGAYPLKTPSAQQSGLKLNIQAQLVAGIEYKLWIDFDTKRSIVVTGNNNYILKPVIRTFAQATSGSVRGIILPPSGVNWVYAIQNMDTIATAKPDLVTGAFLISGLSSGSYTIAVDAVAPLNSRTITGVNVTIGQVSDVGTVQLH